MCPQLLVESLIYFRYHLPSIPAFSGGTAYICITSFKAHACSGVEENICHLPSRLKTKWNVKRSVCILVYVCLKCFRQNSWWYTVHFTPYALLTAEKKKSLSNKNGLHSAFVYSRSCKNIGRRARVYTWFGTSCSCWRYEGQHILKFKLWMARHLSLTHKILTSPCIINSVLEAGTRNAGFSTCFVYILVLHVSACHQIQFQIQRRTNSVCWRL